jgi:hypothetical protein
MTVCQFVEERPFSFMIGTLVMMGSLTAYLATSRCSGIPGIPESLMTPLRKRTPTSIFNSLPNRQEFSVPNVPAHLSSRLARSVRTFTIDGRDAFGDRELTEEQCTFSLHFFLERRRVSRFPGRCWTGRTRIRDM